MSDTPRTDVLANRSAMLNKNDFINHARQLECELNEAKRQNAAAAEQAFKSHCEVMNERDQLRRRYEEEKAIIDRVWKALEITTYEQAKPFLIDEHVMNLRQQLAASQLRESKMREALHNLAGNLNPLDGEIASTLYNEAQEALQLSNEKETRQ